MVNWSYGKKTEGETVAALPVLHALGLNLSPYESRKQKGVQI